MKVLHLCFQDNGGAGRAAFRLHQALLQNNIHSILLVQEKTSGHHTVEQLPKNKMEKFLAFVRMAFSFIPNLFYPNREKDIFSSNFFLSNSKLLKRIHEIDPDIVHLHWINNGFLNIKDLKKIKKPIVWSLHDANPYTGGCHVIPSSCTLNKSCCQKCPMLHSHFKYDISYFTFKAKQKTYEKINLTVNGLSTWIAQCARESMLFHDKPIINLPNPIDVTIYRPIQKDIAKSLLNISIHKKIIAFGAINGTKIKRKGYHELLHALKQLPKDNNYELVIFGSSQADKIAGIKTTFIGHIHDDITLALLYSAADVFISTSLAENLSNVIMESLACGTPVVAFNIGGNGDMILHKQNGYLANNPEEIAQGITWILNHPNYKQLSINARRFVEENFEANLVTQKYIKLYKELR